MDNFREVSSESELAEFARLSDEAERAVAERPPLTEQEKDAGWQEDPYGSGLRWNDRTGEIDDSLFVSHPTWFRDYTERLRNSSRTRTSPSG